MSEAILQQILAKLDSMENRMESMENRMQSLETRMEAMESRMETMETRMQSMEARIGALEDGQRELKDGQTRLEKQMEELKEGQARLEQQMIQGFREVLEELDHLKAQTNSLEKRVIELDKTIRFVNNRVSDVDLDVSLLKVKVEQVEKSLAKMGPSD